MYNLIVVGAGVAGLVAAGKAAALGLSVLVLEKMEKPARKLRITGKGRCNITNTAPLNIFIQKIRNGKEFLTPALENLNNLETTKFINQIGIPTIEERGGRIFPASGQAREVADKLVLWTEKQGAKIICHAPVTKIVAQPNHYKVIAQNTTYDAKNVLITTGGVSYPLTGSTGDGLRFANDLGHEIVPLLPALVALRISQNLRIQNIALKNTKASLFVDGQYLDERFGDVEFNDRGLGGAAILQLSRSAVQAIAQGQKVVISLDLKTALSEQKILNRIARELPTLTHANFASLLRKLVPSALIPEICKRVQMAENDRISKFTDKNALDLAQVLKKFDVPVIDYGSFAEAIITVGGVSLDDVNPLTMESKHSPGLYFAGEVLDIDADTGGYNIQLAISTAALAARSIKA